MAAARSLSTSISSMPVRSAPIAAAAAKQYAPELTVAVTKAGNPSLPEEERLAALRFGFFAPGNDPRVWLDGWHPQVRDAQRAAVARLLRADLDLLAAAVEALHPGIAGQVTTRPGAAMLPAEATAFLAAELPTLLTLPEAARDWGLAAELSIQRPRDFFH